MLLLFSGSMTLIVLVLLMWAVVFGLPVALLVYLFVWLRRRNRRRNSPPA